MAAIDEKASTGVAANRSVSRAIAVLRALAASTRPLTATEIAKRIDLPRATVFRLLLTLEEESFVDRQDTQYSLGWDLARIAQDVDPGAGLVSRVRAEVEMVAEDLGETVTLSVRRGPFDLDLVLQCAPRAIGVTMSDMQGMRWPLHASATGKLLLAELDRADVKIATGGELRALTEKTITSWPDLYTELDTVRNQQMAAIVDELEDGIVSVAVPIRGTSGDLVATLAYVAPAHRVDSVGIDDQKVAMLRRGAEAVRAKAISLSRS